eukprot:TRINITY_DN10873_c0_g1_i1.p1 TRINITY_DN10873_c0_g1~~TRINITY_DN10873_c0_g1_i1.p1  ORF type:complete len:468 (+),score=109.36 TRINITY_DN10873_c0_g1_i1:23-1405(+)
MSSSSPTHHLPLLLFFLLVTLLSVSPTQGAFCHADHKGPPVLGSPNTFPINDGVKMSKLVASTPNGKLYAVSVPNNNATTAGTFHIAHLYGTPYQMGFAQAALYKKAGMDLEVFMNKVWGYLETQVDEMIPTFPKFLQNLIARVGLDAALEFTYLASEPFTGDYFYEEMKGMAAGCGNPPGLEQTIKFVHMIAGLTQGKCSMFGAWGEMLNPDSSTKLLQLRALDWNMGSPFTDYPAMTVYHPAENGGNSFLLVGMAGFIGGLTGVSEHQLGISEIGVSYPDDTFGNESRIGIPFIFVLRDILQWDSTLADSINRLQTAKRTCDLILGVGDGKISQFRGFQYSSSVLRVMNDTTQMPVAEWHPRIKDVAYWGMDWICVGDNEVLGKQLKANSGKLDGPTAIRDTISIEKSGSNHAAFYDLTNLEIYVSYAAPSTQTEGSPDAFDRQFTWFDAKLLFAEKL